MGPRTDTLAGPDVRQRTFLGHPIGLYILFFTEMWERFSYYGMRALLTLYMLNHFKYTQKESSSVYKWYTSLVYLTPLLGGFLADRYLGNKKAVIIGATLMAIGHFLMAFEPEPIFFAALVFLIFGNGFFKPNMSTQVGRLYPQNDARRDGAYTIFYMGINLGAFLSPLICGWLADNTMGGYHSGFTMAGVGMVLGLLIYVFGMPWVVELKQDAGGPRAEEQPLLKDDARPPSSEAIVSAETRAEAGVTAQEAGVASFPPRSGDENPPPANLPLTEAVAERTPSVMPAINAAAPKLMVLVGVVLAAVAPVLALIGFVLWNTVIALEIAAVCALISGWITSKVHNAIRDRVLTIYVLGLFVVFFWAAFEQAGNAMNLWADKITDRYLTTNMKPPEVYPEVPEEAAPGKEATAAEPAGNRWTNMFKLKPKAGGEKEETFGDWWSGLWNPVSTAWFQSINALAIFLLAPVFAYLWIALDRRGLNPSIPTKMAIGVLLMSLAFGLMIFAAEREAQPSSAKLVDGKLPEGVHLNAEKQVCGTEDGKEELYDSGRLTYDADAQTLHLVGVLPDNERDRIVRDTAPKAFVDQVKELAKKTKEATKPFSVSVKLDTVPPGFDLKYAGFPKKDVNFDEKTQTLTATVPLEDKDVKSLLVAGGDQRLRSTLDTLMVDSGKFRVSSWWLFWFYIISTLGELCLSPVGLSMVSKLSPARFATMLMGLWLLTSFFGGFAAGAFGEKWDSMAPTSYFLMLMAALGVAALVLFFLVRRVVGMMHGVN